MSCQGEMLERQLQKHTEKDKDHFSLSLYTAKTDSVDCSGQLSALEACLPDQVEHFYTSTSKKIKWAI